MADEEIDVRVKLKETGKFHQDSRRAAQDVDQITDAEKRAGVVSEKSSKQHAKLNKELNILRRVVGLIKPAALITGLGLAAQGASALAAGGVAAVAALGPLIGLTAAYPALALAAGQAVGVWTLGMKDLGAALGGNAVALKRLTPEGQKFVKTMRPELQKLQEIAQKPLFAGLEEGLKRIRPNLRIFQGLVRDTAKVEGGLITQAGGMLGGKAFGADIQRIGGTNLRVISMLGEAGLSLASAFRHVIISAGPLVLWLAHTANTGARLADTWARTGRASGRLSHFFGETRRVATILGSTLLNLAGGLINVGKAAYPLGLTILRAIQGQAKAFKNWTQSISGRNQLAEFFRRARGPIFETGRLIRDLAGDLLKLSQGNQVGPLIRQVRTQLLPVIFQLVDSTTKQFGPVLIPMLVEVTKLFAALAGSSGPLVLFVRLLTGATKALNWMLDNVPGLKPVLVTVIGAIAVIKALSWVKAIRNVTGLSAAFRRLGINAGVAATETEAASAGSGGIFGVGGRARGPAGRIPTRQMPATGFGQRAAAFGGKATAVAGGAAAAAAGPAGWAVIGAMIVRDLRNSIKDALPAGSLKDIFSTLSSNSVDIVKFIATSIPKLFRGVQGHASLSAQALRRLAAMTERQRFQSSRAGHQLAVLTGQARAAGGLVKSLGKALGLPRGPLRNLAKAVEDPTGSFATLVGKIDRAGGAMSGLSGAVDPLTQKFSDLTGILPLSPVNPNTRHRQHGGTVQTSGLTLVGERGPEFAYLPHGTVVKSAQQTRQAMRAPALDPRNEIPVLELVAPIHVQAGSDTLYRGVTKAAARVRRRKSRTNQ